jgi:hypothetical protein
MVCPWILPGVNYQASANQKFVLFQHGKGYFNNGLYISVVKLVTILFSLKIIWKIGFKQWLKYVYHVSDFNVNIMYRKSKELARWSLLANKELFIQNKQDLKMLTQNFDYGRKNYEKFRKNVKMEESKHRKV